ncbi:uncharacterized protein LOC125838618 [Solanum verrucosum]|uniref:uncharacterized protein LOC125838618 n=1 Tax=Solanum verrucosum TaxID=315347 RepID=UPI0020CFF6BB|nr:uncharacterized protein LOC125838618 [Solanum verrucosum]
MREQQSIQAAFYKLDDKSKHEYRIRLNTSIDVVRLLLDQGFAFRGHDESESSLNKGNFLEVLSWLAARCDAIKPFVLEKAPKNNKMTSHDIQKDIVTACKIEIVKAIIEDINSDYFDLLVDESRDVSCKEQMAICLRYVDKMGFVMEVFIGLVHIKDTSVLSLKKAIVDVLAHHSLTLSNVRGQCYDGASNMQGELGGLITLIRQESRSAHSVHCFAHQLQLTLAAVSKKCVQVGELVLLISNILNVLGASFKRVDNFRESQKKHLQMALDMDELETGRGLNQELDVLGITNDLNVSLQKNEQDIANAMILVKVAKRRLQALRDNEWDPLFKKNIGWDSLKEKVEAFCIKHGISLPNFEDPYTNYGRSRRNVVICTTLHHYRVDVFYKIIDWQLQELNDRFNEVTSDLLNGVSCMNPIDSFSSFDIKKIMRMAELYPDDFDGSNMRALENQLVNYIIDVRDIDERYFNLGGLGELSRKLVETKKHLIYSLVFLLVKFVLLLPVVTATVERAFSAMKIIKNDLRNRMDDEFLNGCIVPYVEKKYEHPWRKSWLRHCWRRLAGAAGCWLLLASGKEGSSDGKGRRRKRLAPGLLLVATAASRRSEEIDGGGCWREIEERKCEKNENVGGQPKIDRSRTLDESPTALYERIRTLDFLDWARDLLELVFRTLKWRWGQGIPKKEKEDGKFNEEEEEKGDAMVVEAADLKRKKEGEVSNRRNRVEMGVSKKEKQKGGDGG